MSVELRPREDCAYDAVSLGEVMLRLDPGEGRIRTAREFRVWEGGGEYNVARGLRLALDVEQLSGAEAHSLNPFLEDEDVLAVLRVGDDLSLQHFEQHSCASARAVLLLQRRHVARTHRPVVVLAAFADADAPVRGLRE